MADVRKLITVPQYYMRFVDENVDLDKERSIPCKFHNEQHGKSFTWSPEKGVWRCWGQCKCGGGVVELHRLNYHLKTKEEAEKSLASILGVEVDKPSFKKPEELHPDKERIELEVLIAKANRLAKTVDDYLDLDYIMSQYPPDKNKLEVYCNNRR